MTREIIDEQKELERVLIIGGANTSIATYLLRQFSKIKKIVICDIDSEIIDVVVKFFANAAEIEKVYFFIFYYIYRQLKNKNLNWSMKMELNMLKTKQKKEKSLMPSL